MEIRVLGPFELIADDGQATDVGGSLPQAVLVALALAEGRLVPAEQLLEQVWPGTGSGDRNRLQVHISRLRKVLGPDLIRTGAGGYALSLPASSLDAVRFAEVAAAGHAALRQDDPAQAADLLAQALSLWRGPALAEFAETEFAAPAIARLEETRLAATEDRIDAGLRLGQHAELTGELETLVRQHPLRERLWAQLMVALYRTGRQADALGAYRRARAVLAAELGVDPGPELRSLEAAILAQDPALAGPAVPAAPPGRRPAGNVPAATSALIGRAADVTAVAAMLGEGRLVTVTGPGGVGKTRLGLEVARDVTADYRDGVWLIELVPAVDDDAVADVLAAGLGVLPEAGRGSGTLDRVGEFLSGRQALLVLDNCEHVIGGAARAAEHLLARCPGLRILATSRESLAIAGEALWPLQPLPVDAASELFMARARAFAPGSEAGEPAMATITAICARLDGLPLAVELAAARMRALSPADILARLSDQFRLLTGGSRTAMPRHQTLRAVIDWSYDLLFDDERRVFERMSAFAGPCPLEAAELVCAGPGTWPADVPDLLAHLVDKSLITAIQTTRGVRFRMLQTIAEYGRERLAAAGELAAVRGRHTRWAASVAHVADSAHGPAWFATFREFTGDIRRAMESSLRAGEPDLSLGIACGIGWFWSMAGSIGSAEDCWQWILASLAVAPERASTGMRVRALIFAEQLAVAQGRPGALAFGEEAISLGRAADDRAAEALAVMLHGSALAGVFGAGEHAAALIEEAGTLLAAETDDWSRGLAALAAGVAALARSDLSRAQTLLGAAVEWFAQTGDALPQGAALRHLADLQVVRVRYDPAIDALERMLAVLPAADHPAAITRMAQLGCLHAFAGRPDQAESWHARAEALADHQQHLHLRVFASNARGLTCRRLGQHAEADRWHQHALALCARRDVPEGVAMARAGLGFLAELRRDAAGAEQHHAASLHAAAEVADRQPQALALEGLAGVAALRGDAAAAARLLGAAGAYREGTVGTVMGQGTAVRETIIGRLFAAEVASARQAEWLSPAMLSGPDYAEGRRDPLAVVASVQSAP